MKVTISFEVDSAEEAQDILDAVGDLGDHVTATAVVNPTADPRVGVALDSTGTPWIDGIHASTKGQTKDGKWRRSKGVTEEQASAAEAAERNKLAATPKPPVLAAPAAPEAIPAVGPTNALPPGSMVGLPPVAAPVVTYEQITVKFGELSGRGLINAATMTQAYATLGVNPVELTTNETMRATLWNWMNQIEAAATAPVTMPGMPSA